MTRLLGAGGVPIPDWMVSEWRSIRDRGQQVYPGVYAGLRRHRSPTCSMTTSGKRSGRHEPHRQSQARAGAAGMALDLENYGVSEALWSVRYPGNTHDAATTRAKMFQRRAGARTDLRVGRQPPRLHVVDRVCSGVLPGRGDVLRRKSRIATPRTCSPTSSADCSQEERGSRWSTPSSRAACSSRTAPGSRRSPSRWG